MYKIIVSSALAISLQTAVFAAPAFETGEYRNLYVEMNIATQAEVTAKVNSAYQQLFYGNESNERVYYEYGTDMAFIKTFDTNDIRSEGMSYAMTIAVMMDDQVAFNKLWKFSKTYMQHASGDLEHYFSWQLQAQAPFSMIDRNSAPDGEEYFAMALLFAANRWGNASGIYDYDTEANAILDAMVNKTPTSTVVPMINPAANQIVFTPDANSEAYTDPSYHVPAFYELFSRWGTQDNAYWQTVAETSRAFFPKAAHPVTGLYSDYSEFDGTPKVTSFNQNSHLSAFDSIRTIHNVAVDYAWFEDDYSAVELSNRILSFYDSQPSYVTVYTHDGVPQVDYRIEAHVAMNAVAALAADIPEAKRFVQDLWDMPVPTGEWRYYNGLLYMLGLLHTSGEFKIYAPGSVEPSAPLAFTQSVETNKGTAVAITLEGSDLDGFVTSFQVTQQPSFGQLNGSGQTLDYVPNAEFVGTDTFQFSVTDNDGQESSSATVTIDVVDDQVPTGGLVCEVTENLWNSGYTARVTVTNDSPTAINSWQVSIALAPGDVVSQSWSATLTGTTGIVTAENIGWNGNLDAGESASFGFKASHTGLNGRPAVSCQ